MKHFILICLLLPLFSLSHTQVVRKAIMIKNHRGIKKNDTVDIKAMYQRYGYIVYTTTIEDELQEIPSQKLRLLNDSLSFWEGLWFRYKSYDILTESQKTPNSYQKKKSLDVVLALEEENKIYNDPFIEDYVLQKLLQIRPPMDYFGNDSAHFSIKLLNQPSNNIFVLPNKTILISIDWLAKTTKEDDLIMALNQAVLYTFFGYHLNHYTSPPMYEEDRTNLKAFPESSTQKIIAHAVRLLKKQKDLDLLSSNNQYLNVISTVVTYVAWQEYYNQNYASATDLLDKIINHDLATDEEYFLKARIYRNMFNSIDKNKEALTFIEKAAKINTFRFPELMEEKGLILLRLNQFDEAQKVFEDYLEVLTSATSSDPQKIKWCRAMINKCSVSKQLISTHQL
jgi:hypothetical protein